MKKVFLVASSIATAFFMGCGSSSSGSDEPFDCNLSGDGVKVFTPAGGEVFKLGDSIEVTFVARYRNAGGFKAYYKASEDDKGVNLFASSIGEEAPDGTRCTTVSAYLDPETIEASDKAFIQIEAYNAGKIRGNSETFTVKE